MGDSDEVSYTWRKVTEDIFAPVTDLVADYANDAVELTWSLPKEEEEPDPDETTTYSFGFENGLEGWTLIDADGDGYNWNHHTNPASIPSHSGDACIYSESYDLDYQIPLNPDNYVVSPQKYAITAGSKITFWACAQDESYPYEHFGVAVSTGSNTSASDFTTIAEWDITGKGGKQGSRGERQTTWIKL